MPKILIIGGSGFLGSALARSLASDHEVVLGGRAGTAGLPSGHERVTFDVTDLASTQRALKEVRPDIVVDCAAFKFDRLFAADPAGFLTLNVQGALNVCRASRSANVRVVIGISSNKAASPQASPYGMTKALMERTYARMNRPDGTSFLCVRLGHLAWSPGTVLETWQAMHEATGVIRSDGWRARRYFMRQSDAVAAVATAVNEAAALGGQVIVPRIKAARLQTVLDLWARELGGRWEALQGPRPTRDVLISAAELRCSSARKLGGRWYRVFSPGGESDGPESKAGGRAIPYMSESEVVEMITRQGW